MGERVLPKKALLAVSGLAALFPIFAPSFKPDTASAPIPQNTSVCVNLGNRTEISGSPDFMNMQKNLIKPDWTKKESPTKVYIPKLNYADNLKPMNLIPDEINGGQTLQTPDEGLGTPEKPLTDIVFIYGHSWWNRQQNPISQIDRLRRGDEIIIENSGGARRTYVVSGYKLFNYTSEFTLDDDPDGTLVLQTTAIISNQWLIDEQKVKSDLWPFIPEISDHAAFQVIAIPKK